MSRPIALDFLHNMRFHVSTSATPGMPGNLTASYGQGMPTEAGFVTCSIPTATVETVTYKEGNFLYTKKYPGHTTYDDITMQRGVAKVETGFWRWISTVIQGTAEYRVDLSIKHYHRADPGILPGYSSTPSENLGIPGANPSRQYVCYQAFPTSLKFSSDLDATSSEVSIQDLGVSYEFAAVCDSTGAVVQ